MLKVSVTSRWWEWTDNVQMDLVKMDGWGGESREWCDCVPLYLGSLTPDIGPCLLPDIHLDAAVTTPFGLFEFL